MVVESTKPSTFHQSIRIGVVWPLLLLRCLKTFWEWKLEFLKNVRTTGFPRTKRPAFSCIANRASLRPRPHSNVFCENGKVFLPFLTCVHKATAFLFSAKWYFLKTGPTVVKSENAASALSLRCCVDSENGNDAKAMTPPHRHYHHLTRKTRLHLTWSSGLTG